MRDTTKISLEEIGANAKSISERIWYASFLEIVKRALNLSVAFHGDNENLSFSMLFIDYFRNVVLKEISQQIVIIIDEIDSLLNLDFRGDFFAAIRFLYNLRTQEPEFSRLTFVLVGVASPTDLIDDKARTPFNIGRAILLDEIHPDKALISGLNLVYPAQGEQILNRVFYWTSGHPYLTQATCKEIVSGQVSDKKASLNDQDVDEIVRKMFLSENNRDQNLSFLKRFILQNDRVKPEILLDYYLKVSDGEKVKVDEQSDIQKQLLLSGLIKVSNGYLTVRNRIYETALNKQWVRENLSL